MFCSSNSYNEINKKRNKKRSNEERKMTNMSSFYEYTYNNGLITGVAYICKNGSSWSCRKK